MTPIARAHPLGGLDAGPPVMAPEARALTGAIADAEPVAWTWNPWVERPGRAAIALTFTLGAFALVVTITSSAVYAALLALAVGATLAPLLLPSQCRVDETGIALHRGLGWERRPWSQLRRARAGRDAIVMSPFTHPRRLDVFRALVLPIPAARREAVLAGVRTHCERHEL